MQRKYIAEFVGTFALVFLAVGTAVVGISTHGTGFVALAFGLVLVLGVYAIGPISGCHINPAVTIAMVVARKMPISDAVGYWIAQVAGAVAGGAVLKLMVSSFGVTDQTGGLGTNGYGKAINAGGDALKHLWLFILAPLVGGVLAALAYGFVRAEPTTVPGPDEARAT